MRREAEKILRAFHQQGLEPGDHIVWLDFDEDVIRFEDGALANDGTRQGFLELRDSELVVEAANGLILTEAGQRYIDEHLA